MKIQILDTAQQDLIDGHNFYETIAEGLGSYFLDSLFSDIESLLITSGVHSIHFKRYHRLLSKRFPFAIYYRVDSGITRVYAVLDCRRSPAWIRKKIKN